MIYEFGISLKTTDLTKVVKTLFVNEMINELNIEINPNGIWCYFNDLRLYTTLYNSGIQPTLFSLRNREIKIEYRNGKISAIKIIPNPLHAHRILTVRKFFPDWLLYSIRLKSDTKHDGNVGFEFRPQYVSHNRDFCKCSICDHQTVKNTQSSQQIVSKEKENRLTVLIEKMPLNLVRGLCLHLLTDVSDNDILDRLLQSNS